MQHFSIQTTAAQLACFHCIWWNRSTLPSERQLKWQKVQMIPS